MVSMYCLSTTVTLSFINISVRSFIILDEKFPDKESNFNIATGEFPDNLPSIDHATLFIASSYETVWAKAISGKKKQKIANKKCFRYFKFTSNNTAMLLSMLSWNYDNEDI
jgi:hypothetical protein